mmetsp:Transcript_88718/g.254042  ORF Transcript_88718/g.254042 Transcript_88718/m.254042 type:complete len:330 (+) Transcript_88718:1104-2093(+)
MHLCQRRQGRLRIPGDRIAGQDLHCVLDGLDLLRTRHLVLLELYRLCIARRLRVAQSLLVLGLGLLRDLQVALEVRGIAELPSLGRRLLRGARLVRTDVIRQLLQQHLVVRLGVHLRLLQGQPLFLELTGQLLKHLHDTARLELVSIGLRLLAGFHCQEGLNHLNGVGRDLRRAAHLRQRLRNIGTLALQHRDGLLARIDGLRKILVLCHVVPMLLLAQGVGRGSLRLRLGDLALKLIDFLAKNFSIRLGLGDVRIQLRDLGCTLFDALRRRLTCAVAPSLELCELDFLCVLLLLPFRQHAIQQLDHLLHRSHSCDGSITSSKPRSHTE